MTNLIRISACFISVFLLACISLQAQVQDTIAISTKRRNDTYGLRVGLDLKKITQTLTDSRYKGFEIIGDYRLTKKLYLAGELGTEEKSITDNSVSTTASGGYLKAGIDVNVHKNLIGMRNLIYIGTRYGFGTYSQKLDRFSIATTDSFFPSQQIDGTFDESGLTSHWLEFLAGLKVEILDNLFLGFSVSVQHKIIEDKPEGFDNLYIPGFGTTNDFSNFSAGFNYFISYYLPLYKKKPKKIEEKEDPEQSKIDLEKSNK